MVSGDELAKIQDEIRTEATEAVQYALDAPYPDGSEVDMHVFKEAGS